MTVNNMDLPYKCPLVEDQSLIREDFVKVTETVWKKLIEDPRIFDLVYEDSRFRDEEGRGIVLI